jgi:hypothetical protein
MEVMGSPKTLEIVEIDIYILGEKNEKVKESLTNHTK